MKFVIDTNILFSALIKKSITRRIILSDVMMDILSSRLWSRFILQRRY